MDFDVKYYEKLGFSKEEIDLTKLLYYIAKEVTNKNTILGGGTSLLLSYGLNRPSTDLDLYTDKIINSYDIKKGVLKCFKELNIVLLNYSDRGKENYFKELLFKYKYNNKEDFLKIECKFDKEKLMYKNNIVNKNNIYIFNNKNICIYKTNAFLARDKVRDIYDVGFLIHHFPNNFNDEKLFKIKNKLDILGKEEIKKMFKGDKILNRFDSDAIIDLIYKDIEKLTLGKKNTINNGSKNNSGGRK
jgi:hypothetical protein